MRSRSTSGIPGISGRRYRRTAVAASAATLATALIAAGATTGSAGAAPQKTAKMGATSAPSDQLSASQRAMLLREAAATARTLSLGAKEKLVVKDVIKDADGATHIRYDRTYDGLPVLGGDLIVHKSARGSIEDVTKATEADIKVADTNAAIAPSDAERTAVRAAQAAGGRQSGTKHAPRKVIWAATGTPVLAYETVVGGFQDDGTPSELHVITDAATGKKLRAYQAVKTAEDSGTGKSQYSGTVTLGTTKSGGKYLLKDTSRGGHQTYDFKHSDDQASGHRGSKLLDADNVWGNGKPTNVQTAAVDAHYGVAKTWDYYKNVLGRNGIWNNGKAAYTRVHYGNNEANAFWWDECSCMMFGDGKGNKKPITELDVVGHEMSHGLVSATAHLGDGEPWGLDEGSADIFGTAVEFHAKNPADVGDYLIGEKVDLNGDGKPLRYMDKPSKDGKSKDYWYRGIGDIDGHYSSGVARHFFYLLSEGSGRKVINGVTYNSPTKDGRTVKGIGRAKAEQIWYKALSTYMTSTTDYHAARTATLKAAKALYGANSTEQKAVDNAWAGVNVM